MREILDAVDTWRARGDEVAVATVVETWGSAPRREGAKLALTAGGEIAGSVSGGCVEAAVVEAGREVLASGVPRLLSFGVSDEQAWEVGLACGGTVVVLVQPLAADAWSAAAAAVRNERPVAILTHLDDDRLGEAVRAERDAEAIRFSPDPVPEARETLSRALEDGRSQRVALTDGDVFVDVTLPPPTLVMVGGVHVAQKLVPLARTLGFRTIVVDPRPAFGSAERFPDVDRLVDAWPDDALTALRLDAATAVAVLTHDPKLDDPALGVALRSRAFYVGALGSKRTQEKRRHRLREAGVGEEELARLHAPIGLDLGGRSPEEIALAVLAQVVAARHGKA